MMSMGLGAMAAGRTIGSIIGPFVLGTGGHDGQRHLGRHDAAGRSRAGPLAARGKEAIHE